MKLLLLLLLSVFMLGLRADSSRADVRWAVPVLVSCCLVAIAFLSQRAL